MRHPVNFRRPAAIRRKGGGFTLVELMVTVVIVVVLAGLAVVVSRRALAKAAQAKAVSSLRQVASANVGYSTENQGNINTMRWLGDPKEGRPYVGNSFWGRLQPYLFAGATTTNQKQLQGQIRQSLDQLFSTPDADTMKKTVLDGSRIYHDGSGLPVPIAFNSNLYQWNKDVKVTQFGDASNVIYAAYGFGMFDEQDGQTFTERPTDGSKPDNNLYYLDNGKALVAFLDGRIEFLAAPMPSRRFE